MSYFMYALLLLSEICSLLNYWVRDFCYGVYVCYTGSVWMSRGKHGKMYIVVVWVIHGARTNCVGEMYK